MAKKICIYGMLTALCMVLGYLESLLSLSFIAPGIKPGLANTVALLLIAQDDRMGALAVNVTRILLSALLFGNPMALLFSLSGGLASWAVMSGLSRLKKLSVLGVSITGGAVHNLFQLIAATFVVGRGALFYLPVLLLFGGVCGALIGALAKIILKKMKTNGNF